MNATAQVVNAELLSRIKRLQEMVDSGETEMDAPSPEDNPRSTCSFTVYGQFIPTSVPDALMRELEDEMENPTGITTVKRPDLKMNGVLVSKKCGIMFEVKEAEGLKCVAHGVFLYCGLTSNFQVSEVLEKGHDL